jgi:hypothetical protein
MQTFHTPYPRNKPGTPVCCRFPATPPIYDSINLPVAFVKKNSRKNDDSLPHHNNTAMEHGEVL